MMAVFEKQYDRLFNLDDTEQLTCVVETAQEVQGHTEYLLRVQRGPHKQNSWKILRRYNEFAELNKTFFKCGINLPMPRKCFIGNMRPDFIAERRQALQIYINIILMNPILASSLPAKRFIDPDSYSQSFHDQALQNSSLCLRNDGNWLLGSSFGAIGWRLRKHYFKVCSKPPEKTANKQLVKCGSQAQQCKNLSSTCGNESFPSSSSDNSPDIDGLVLEWIEYGPDKYIDDKELGGILKNLTGLQHPSIEPILYSCCNENGGLIIRKFHRSGTLKDLLYMSTPINTYLSKYGNPKRRKALTLQQVATYGLQILDALIFLQSKGFPHGHLHSGNIVIVNNSVKLLDIENLVLGVPAFYRPFFVQHSKIHTIEAIDVYSFGHVMFEMAMGYPMQESVLRQTNDFPESLKNILELILSKEACRTGLPTLEQLKQHEFFANVSCVQKSFEESLKPQLKLPLNAKDIIKNAIQRMENRLRDEQKSVKNQKRIVRVQELMSSEEEKRKLKQKTKYDQKQARLKQQSSLHTNNGTTLPTISSLALTSNPSLELHHNCTNNTHSQVISSNFKEYPEPCTSSSVFSQQRTTIPVVERQSSSPNITQTDNTEPSRVALLQSICTFNRGSLRKVRSND